MKVAPLHPDSALFLDFDGTLAPIQDDPDTVVLPENGASILSALRDRLDGALVIISGRDIRDLSLRIPGDLWRIGGHGLDICAPGETPATQPHQAPQGLAEELEGLTSQYKGTRLEDKGAVFAIHYRAVPEVGDSLATAAAAIIERTSTYIMQHGKMVIEAKPATANKGAALCAMMKNPGFLKRNPVMVGDDVTDEDAMVEALRAGGSAVKVGDGSSAATLRLPDPAAVWNWLERSISL